MGKSSNTDLAAIIRDALISPDQESLDSLFKRRLEELNITKSQAYDALEMDKKTIEPILSNEAKQVDAIKLLKIGEFLNIETSRLIQLYLQSSSTSRLAEFERTQKAKFIFENFDLPELKNLGFIADIKDLNAIEKRITTFFKLNSLYDYWDETIIQTAFSRTKSSSSARMRAFWLKTARAQFETINNPFDFNREKLKQLIARIRPYSRDIDNGFFKVCQALYHAGVTVIFQRKIPKTQVRGATFVVNDKPGIVITDLNKRYGTIWFALLHELFHVLYHMEEIKIRSYHLTGDPELWLENETEADNFAREYWVPEEKMKFVTPFIFDHFLVEKYAKDWNIHPCLIYNFYGHDHPEFWPGVQKYDPGTEGSVAKINVIPFDRHDVEETVEEIKKNLELA